MGKDSHGPTGSLHTCKAHDASPPPPVFCNSGVTESSGGGLYEMGRGSSQVRDFVREHKGGGEGADYILEIMHLSHAQKHAQQSRKHGGGGVA